MQIAIVGTKPIVSFFEELKTRSEFVNVTRGVHNQDLMLFS